MKPSDLRDELQKRQDDVSIFRKLISNAHNSSTDETVKDRQAILMHITEILSSNCELGDERASLACHAFYVLLSTEYDSRFVNDTAVHCQQLCSRDLHFLEKQYTVCDPELFKLLNAYGYLQASQRETFLEYDTLLAMFDVIHKNCMKYTRYSYFAYKVLHTWLRRLKETSDTRFWHENDCILERKLEAVIFSNWFNALNDVCKQNSQIFNVYLRIVSRKYNGFLEHVFHVCVRDVSWQNETKYTILAEICQVWDATRAMTTRDFLLDLCTSLTKNSLRCGGTKLYLVILRKLNEDEWKEAFGNVIKHVVERWESGEHEDHNALQSLFKYWLEPTIETHRGVLLFLWMLCSDSSGYFFRSHLQRMAGKLHVELPHGAHEIDLYVNDKEEIVRLNAFAVLCYRAVDLIDINETNPFFLIKRFLWFNANATTILMREGVIKYFAILCSNILKATGVEDDCARSVSEFMEWLSEYFLDCFEIGSCYQRKILALNLYRTLLSFMDGNFHSSCAHHRDCFRYVTTIDKCLKTSWRFTDKESLFVLLRLVLDSALDIRQLAAALILKYFTKDVLSTTEKHILYDCAWKHCNSSKFYKIESGAALMRIIAHWLPSNEVLKDATAVFVDNEEANIVAYSNYSQFLLNEARCQLTEMKGDILKAIVENRPFYGVLTALLTVAFHSGPENWILTPGFTEEVLNLLKDAVNFFLSTLSTTASNTAYSSSFAEMGLAIDEKIKTSKVDDANYDELQLSPAYQVLISCIWMSLKVSCQIASEIGILMQSDAQVRCSVDIIVTVLLKCRHKGVVESAGVAIANLSRNLYERKEYSDLPRTYLLDLLKDDAEKLLHLTRRGAGLSIMFHRLVVSDVRRNRPTVHLAVQTLLRALENSAADVRHAEAGQDSPWAKRLHFLRALVADREIHAQLIPYMENICLTCFEYMESDVWTVRNASLQLYGAVVPRLVGQCSGKGGGSLDFGNGYSVNHFVTHYPSLASRMRVQLHNVSRLRGTSTASLRSYSSVAHTLVLLSKLSTGGCDLIDYPTLTFLAEVKHLVRAFLSNPMTYVRQLAAKAYAALTPSARIQLEIQAIGEALPSCDTNTSHGYLLTRGYLKDKLNDCTQSFANVNYKETKTHGEFNFENRARYLGVSETWSNMCKREVAKQPCYVLETLFLQESVAHGTLCADRLFSHCSLSMIERIASSQKIQPGFFQFVGLWARLYAVHLKEKLCVSPDLDGSDREMVRGILSSNCADLSIEFLSSLSHCVPLLRLVLGHLISLQEDRHQLLVEEMVTFTLKTIKRASSQADVPEFDALIEELNQMETSSSMISVRNSLILACSRREALITEVLSRAFRMCTDEKQSARLTAAEYVELALHRFTQLENGNKLTVMRCCLILMKDEIAEIREIASTSLQRYAFRDGNSTAPSRLQHEEVVYQRLLREVFRCRFDAAFAEDDINFVRCFTRSVRDVDSNAIIENPFNHDDSTFHREESKFLNMYSLHAKFRLDDESAGDDGGIREGCFDVTQAIQTRHFKKFREKAGLIYDDLRVILYIKEMNYLARKRDVIIQQ
ncbi:hypothetical protein DMN91_005366 [Ooceraea biroi]|uniref:Thyroid adenoma-associated protein-like protein n=1 Tax=Ooceraea biroi TaxID=2015173 RepID=A0A026X0R9_OOCBI|nr:uncharacterized protein LOC105287524 [Ooceraea biroi]XP_019889892.1 uncharacterized protein LOC105287524 [Ooceraea biroi]EZA60989.1 Thyroid adenoma-associated protein-like protein [Ooceraea biroi]RLU23088.1 hypothetical protein DMN91_005366 [Ooceraea biroi]